jgi:cation transport regulator ChaB
MANPMMMIIANMNATILEAFAAAQKDWADFFQRRVKEDVAVSRQLMSHCHSLPDMHRIYSQYLETAFEQYREQSEHAVQRSTRVARHLAETTTEAKASEPRPRH